MKKNLRVVQLQVQSLQISSHRLLPSQSNELNCSCLVWTMNEAPEFYHSRIKGWGGINFKFNFPCKLEMLKKKKKIVWSDCLILSPSTMVSLAWNYNLCSRALLLFAFFDETEEYSSHSTHFSHISIFALPVQITYSSFLASHSSALQEFTVSLL